MTDHPNAADYRNLAERNEAFWREIAGELAGALGDMNIATHPEHSFSLTLMGNARKASRDAISRYTAAIGDAKP